MEEFYDLLYHYSIIHYFSVLFKQQLVICLKVTYFLMNYILISFLMTELFVTCFKFRIRKDSCYIENIQLIESVIHFTSFYFILPLLLSFTEKIYVVEQLLIRATRLNSFYLLNLIWRQFYFSNYQDSLKSSIHQVFLKIDVEKQPRELLYRKRCS